MRTSLLIKVYTKFWWLQMLLGIAFIVFEIWIILVPKEGYAELSLFFAIAILLTGAFEIATWFVLLFFGILIVAMGILILAKPEIGSYTIIYATSIAFISTEIIRIILGRSLYQYNLK